MTVNYVPRGDMEGQLGTGEKRWAKAYIGNVSITYDTVADMVADLELREGSTAATKGYHSINDGGNGFYNIREKLVSDVDDGGSVIFLANGNVAELIINDIIYVKQFGAYGDGVHDDHDAIQKSLNMLHTRKASIVDLDGYSYITNSCIHIDSMYKCTIRNGTLISNNFNVDSEDVTNNFIFKTTDYLGDQTLQPGSYGYCFEDCIVEKITFDCQGQQNVGCFYLNTFFRVLIQACDFRRFGTFGITMSDSTYKDGHELTVENCWFRTSFKNEPSTNGTALRITKPDNIFTNLIIVGSLDNDSIISDSVGIIVESKANTFSKIHIYRYDIGVYLKNNLCIFEQMYFDSCSLKIKNPWHTSVVNSFWLAVKKPIIFEYTQASNATKGLHFIGCMVWITEAISDVDLPIITTNIKPTGVMLENIFDFSCGARTKDNSALWSSSKYMNNLKRNYINIDDDTTSFLCNGDGVIGDLNAGARYTFSIVNNELKVTNYNTTGYQWLCFLIDMPQNTEMIVKNLYENKNLLYRIFGFNGALESGKSMTLICAESQNFWNDFNSGNFDHYALAVYGLGTGPRNFLCQTLY